MDSFVSYLRNHGLKLWLSNFVGTLISMVIMFIAYVVIFLVALATLAAEVVQMWNTLRNAGPNTNPSQAPEAFQALGESLTSYIVPAIICLVILILLSMFVASFNAAGLYASCVETVRDKRLKFSTYFRTGLSNTLPIFVLTLLILLVYLPFIIVGVAIVALLLAIFNDPLSSVLIGILMFVIFLALFILLSMITMNSFVILSAEKVGPWRALTLSFKVFRKATRKVVITALQVFLIGLAFALVILLIHIPNIISFFDPVFLGPTIAFVISIVDMVIIPVVSPLVAMLVGLLITYRYFKYMRQTVFPEQTLFDTDHSIADNTPFAVQSPEIKPEDEKNEPEDKKE